MIKEKLRNIIAKRIATNPEYDYGIELCWNEAMQLVKEKPEEVLAFIKQEATEEEVYWLSERLCEIFDITNDERFVEAFSSRANKIADEEMKRSILQEVGHV